MVPGREMWWGTSATAGRAARGRAWPGGERGAVPSAGGSGWGEAGGQAAAAPEPEVPMKPGTRRVGQPGPPRPHQQVSGEVRAGFGGQSGGPGWMAAVPALSPHRHGSPCPFVPALGQWLCGTGAQLQLCAMGHWGGTHRLHSQGRGVPWGGQAQCGTKPLRGLSCVGSKKRLSDSCVFVNSGT